MKNFSCVIFARRFFGGLPWCCLLLLLLAPALSRAQMSGNPILPVYTADPDILFANGRYYIYPTANGAYGREFHAYSSADLTNWKDEGIVFNLNSVSWAKNNGWAPSVVARNGKYYFYFTAEEKIGVAVGSSPTGPFVDSGRQLVTCCGGHQIDPMAFVDTDGQAYLYYGNTTFNVVKLNADMVSTTGSISNNGPSNFFEASYVIKRGSTYYLMYSVNDYKDPDYHVEYATSSSPLGPWTTRGRITAPIGNIKGPGHNAVIAKPGCDEYYFVYHRRTSDDPDQRQVAIERMFFADNGAIQPINITTAGVIARPGANACPNNRPVADGSYRIVSKLTTTSGTPLVLDIAGCTDGPGDVRTWVPTDCRGQRWQLSYANGFYKIVSQQPSHVVLDLANCDLKAGTDVGVYNDLNNDCQRWRIEEAGNGWYRFISKASGNALDVVNCDQTPGANVATWTWNGLDCQLFRFEAISAARVALATGTGQAAAPAALAAYPNPAHAQLTVPLPPAEAGAATLRLRDGQGRLVRELALPAGAAQAQLDLRGLPQGLYLLQVQAGAQTQTSKILVQP